MSKDIFELIGTIFSGLVSIWALGAFAVFVIEKSIERAEFFNFVWKYLQHKNKKQSEREDRSY